MDGIKAITKIRHIGREKFSIIEHSGTKLEVNSVIVASEILNCKAEKN